MNQYLDTARRVIRTERLGLEALEEALGESFVEAVDVISKATGRVIVSGMGKSGHIARKIAATLASTGTPAHFVHPAEASHGDLGMTAQGDVVLVLSFSGETPELADLIAHTRRFAIPLIGVAARPESTLLKQSDVAIVLPSAEEACGNGIVPTTSTTMTLALGDAIAIALMEHRQFTPHDFKTFHPGGKLGAKLAKVSDLMHDGEDIPLVGRETPMSDALLTMTASGWGTVGVLNDDGELAGIITDGDLRRHMEGLLNHVAKDVMTRDPQTIGADALAAEAVGVMNMRKISNLFVVDPAGSKRVVGFLRLHDCIRAGAV